jgi:hypothetical protein
MIRSLVGPRAASPLLHLGLQKIARTPRPRLQVGYHLVDRSNRCRTIPAMACDSRLRAPSAPEQIVQTARLAGALQPAVAWILGNRLEIEWLLAGGIVGERLPLANLRCEAAERMPCGGLVDLVA